MKPSPGDVTTLLRQWAEGEEKAYEHLIALVYDDLRRVASRYMNGERVGHTLQTTALIHEAFLRLAGEADKTWTDRQHFFAIAARAMRQILVEHARRVASKKRGGHAQKVELESASGHQTSEESASEVLGVHRALDKLETLDPRQARVVEYRFFAGFSHPEISELLGISESTVNREWRAARLWLQRELQGG